MFTPILATKLYIPPSRPNLIPRPRLVERLNRGLLHTPTVTLVSAPAGFGKTTLVSDWLRQSKLAAARLALDEADNDPTRFLTYLVAALQQADREIGQTEQDLLQSSHPTPPETLLTVLINEIAAASKQLYLTLGCVFLAQREYDGALWIEEDLSFYGNKE